MNDNIEGMPYSTAEFDKAGKPLTAATVPPGTTDVIVISHGWNNDRGEAEALYTKLVGNLVDVTAGDAAFAARKVAVVGVIWPSKKFDDFITVPSADAKTAGGAASAGGAVDRAASETAMRAAIERAAPVFDDPGDAARVETLLGLVPKLEEDGDAQREFVETLRKLIDPDGSKAGKQTKEDGADVFHRSSPEVIFQRASDPTLSVTEPINPEMGGSTHGSADASGRAAGIGSFLAGAVNGVSNLMNLTTYFKMKERAGTVGRDGLAPLLDQLAGQVERIHLVGHSFGGRLVTAAAASSTTDKLHSLSLLQAAFSHNGFSKKRIKGFFRAMVDNRRINGPILVTHTKNDKAVGLAYPIASRIGRDQAAGFGDADDEFGGIGSNGAQQMEDGEIEASTNALQPVGADYVLQRGKFHNLESTAFIVAPDGGDAHGFVFVPQVAWAISRAVLS